MKQMSQHTIALTFFLGLGYFLLAKIGFATGALTTNATLIWPASGFAVFSCIAFGKRATVGIFFGALIADQLLTLAPTLGHSLFTYSIASINGLASIAQALLIAQLARFWYTKRFRVDTRSASMFTAMVLAGCLISATINIICLWRYGIISLSDALQNWGVWWLGDSIGILIITPLLLWLFDRHYLEHHSQTNAFLIFCAGIGIVLLSVAGIGHNERETQRKSITHEASALESLLQADIDLAIRDLDTLQDYFLTTTSTIDDFKILTKPLLKRNLWLDSFTTIPIDDSTAHSSLTTSDKTIRGSTLVRNGSNDVKLRESTSTFSPDIIASILAEPSSIYAHFSWQPDTNTSTETPENIPIITITQPINFCRNTQKTDCKIVNAVSTELNLNNLMRSVLAKTQNSPIDIYLSLQNTDKTNSSLHWQSNHWQISDINIARLTNSPIQIDHRLPMLRVANTEWKLIIIPTNFSIWFLPSIFQMSVLVFGLLLISLLSAYLQTLHRNDQLVVENQERLKAEIQTQTQSLRTTNHLLMKEVDEKRITQEQLKDSENHMRTLLDNIPDPIWFTSNEGAHLGFNKAVKTLFLHDEKTTTNAQANPYSDRKLESAIRDFETLALNSEQAVRRELWMFIPLRGEKRLMDTIKVAVRNEHKESIGILSIARDITDQHQLIAELEKFKRFAEYASEGFSIMTLEAKTFYMNRSMSKMLKVNIQFDRHHADFLNYFPAELHREWQHSIFPHILLHGFWQGELSAIRADGTRFPTKETFFIIRDDKAAPLYIGGVMRDISEQKQIEQALQLAKETAEEATQAKSRFLANMSHEIRTPLNAVLGYSQLLIADPSLSDPQHERINSILNAGQRLLHLINDILDLSKIEAGALHLRQDYFDLQKELKDIIALMQTKAANKGLSLVYDIHLPTPAIVKSDRQKIGQIILNLLGNAIKFTARGEISFSANLDHNGIIFTISDTGPGIAAQELQQLFALFKQGKAGEESGGTGLGLVISKHLAESLGGELVLDSQPGIGTHAHLRLPLAIEYNTAIELDEKAQHPKLAIGSHCTVLIVEDDFDSRDLLSSALQQMGCSVTQAINGREGLHKILTENFDIVFTDIRMPELTGSDMLKKIRQQIPAETLPIIAVSASSLEHERSFYLSEGFQEFIGKPYSFNTIYAALKKFTRAAFIDTQDTANTNPNIADKIQWAEKSNCRQLHDQFASLKRAFNSGNMQSSKKLFSQFTAADLGKVVYSQLHHAIRQYDLVLAEKIITEVLNEINATLH